MSDTAEFIKLLETITVDSKDDGNEFVVTNRVSVIENLLDTTAYKLIVREPLSLVYAKHDLREGDSIVLVSSHIDALHESSFCRGEGDFLRGTFDNSFGNAAILWLMLLDKLPDNVVVAFTGDEEHDSQGAVQTVLALGCMQCRIKSALVLDVTNVGWKSGSRFTIENDSGIDIFISHRIVEAVNALGLKYAFEHNAEPDESWTYSDYGIPSLSICIPSSGDLHGNQGVLLRKSDLKPFCDVVLSVLNALNY